MLWCVLSASMSLAATAEVRWIGAGRLMLEGNTLVEVASGEATPLLYPTRRVGPSGSHQNLPMAISPSGQVALIDSAGSNVFLGLIDGVLVSRVELPALVAGTIPRDAVHAALWVDDRRLLLHQAVSATGEVACALLDVSASTWSTVSCPPSDFVLTYDYVPGPGGWIAVYSGGEGSSAVRLIRWDPEGGTRDSRTLSRDPVSAQAGPVEVFFSDNGDVRLTAPCGLNGEECDDPSGMWLYAWLPSGDLRFLRKGLPDGVIPSGEDAFSWIEADMLCLGDPDGERRCTPLKRAGR